MPRARGRRPDLSAYARQPARGPTMLAHFVAMLAYVGLSCGQCGPILWLCWPMLAYVGLMLTHVEPKDPKKGNSQKNTVKRRIFWWPAAYLGAMLAHLGAMLAHLGAMLAHLGAMLAQLGARLVHLGGHVGPAWGHVGPSWGLCWRILRSMLAHVDPSWATSSEKLQKMRRAQNTVKRGGFWRGGEVGGRGRGPSLLRRGENCRTAMPRPGGPWMRLRPGKE